MIWRRMFRMMRFARLDACDCARVCARSSRSLTLATDATIAFIMRLTRGSMGTKSESRSSAMAPSTSPPYLERSLVHNASSSPIAASISIRVPRLQSAWSTTPR